jgi:hypothetical protein
MRNYLLAPLLLLTAGWMGCAGLPGWQTVDGSGNVVTEDRQVSGFEHLSISGEGELIVSQGDEESLTIETDDNLLPLIKSEVHNGRLSIGPRNANLRPTKGTRYRLNLRKLNGLESSGSAKVEADTINTERLAVNISGSGEMKISHLESRELSTHISGSGSMSVAGHAATQDISLSGSGNLHASNLKSSKAEAHISGSGHATLWVTEELTAHISGSGSVEYRGDATVESHVSGSGKVRRDRGEQ